MSTTAEETEKRENIAFLYLLALTLLLTQSLFLVAGETPQNLEPNKNEKTENMKYRYVVFSALGQSGFRRV